MAGAGIFPGTDEIAYKKPPPPDPDYQYSECDGQNCQYYYCSDCYECQQILSDKDKEFKRLCEIKQELFDDELEDLGYKKDEFKSDPNEIPDIKFGVEFEKTGKLGELAKELNQLHKKCSARNFKELGRSPYKMEIKLLDDEPIAQKAYRRSATENEIIEKMLDELQEAGLIEESTSPYSAPLILVKKKDGKYRLVIDYRALNRNIKAQAFPMPNIDNIINALKGYITRYIKIYYDF